MASVILGLGLDFVDACRTWKMRRLLELEVRGVVLCVERLMLTKGILQLPSPRAERLYEAAIARMGFVAVCFMSVRSWSTARIAV